MLFGGCFRGHIEFCGCDCDVTYINLLLHASIYSAQNAYYRMSIFITILKQRHLYCLGIFYPLPSRYRYTLRRSATVKHHARDRKHTFAGI